MKRIRWITAILLLAALLVCLSAGCGGQGAKADAPVVLKEPQYVGTSDEGYPVFHFSWSKAKKLWYYDMAVYLVMDGYEERSRISFTDRNETGADIPFLKGIGTDTATYRIKIRALQSGNDGWSEIWQIAFVDGVSTVTGNALDFDPPKVTAKPAPEGTPVPTLAPASHTFPEPLLAYAAKERGVESIDLSGAVCLLVQVNHCEYGEPTQTIADPSAVAAAVEALSGVTVTGGSDGMSNTGTHYLFQFEDADGNSLASFAFQDGMLMEDDGRYPVAGLDALYAVEGVMLSDDWAEYREAESEKADAYVETFRLSYPASVFALSGYPACLLADIDPANIAFISVRVGWNDYAGTLDTQDPAVIRRLYDALSGLRVTGKMGEPEKQGQEWTVRFSFLSPDASTGDSPMQRDHWDDIPKTAYLSFQGDHLLSGMMDGGTETPYTLEGLSDFFDCTDADVLRYLKESRNTSRPKPVYS